MTNTLLFILLSVFFVVLGIMGVILSVLFYTRSRKFFRQGRGGKCTLYLLAECLTGFAGGVCILMGLSRVLEICNLENMPVDVLWITFIAVVAIFFITLKKTEDKSYPPMELF